MNAKDKSLGLTPLWEVDQAVATITLRRPAVMNRLQAEDVIALREMFQRVNEDTSIRVLVITGEGRVFSAGYDLDDLGERSGALPQRSGAERPMPDFPAMTVELENVRVPTVCWLNGSVYGGATDLALSCDFRAGPSDIEMFMPASRLGLHYYTEGLIRWSHRLGTNAARRLFLTAETIPAQEMLRIGYLTHMWDRVSLDAQVGQLLQTLAAQAPKAVEGMKRALNEIARGQLDHAASDARHHQSLISLDLREGIAAWHEKRSPRFTGQ